MVSSADVTLNDQGLDEDSTSSYCSSKMAMDHINAIPERNEVFETTLHDSIGAKEVNGVKTETKDADVPEVKISNGAVEKAKGEYDESPEIAQGEASQAEDNTDEEVRELMNEVVTIIAGDDDADDLEQVEEEPMPETTNKKDGAAKVDRAATKRSAPAESSRNDGDAPNAKRARTDGGNVDNVDNADGVSHAHDAANTDKNGEAKIVRKLKKQVKRMTKEDLEDLVARSVCEVMSGRSEIGSLRQRIDVMEENVTRWRDKAQSLAKQVKDLTTVVNKYTADTKAAKETGVWVEPVVITRSVGLQVCTPSSGTGRLPSLTGPPTPAATPTSTAPATVPSPVRGKHVLPGQVTRAPQIAPQNIMPLARLNVTTTTPTLPTVPIPPAVLSHVSNGAKDVDVVDLADDDDDNVAPMTHVASARQVRMLLPNNGAQNVPNQPITYRVVQQPTRGGATSTTSVNNRQVFMTLPTANGRSNVTFLQQQQNGVGVPNRLGVGVAPVSSFRLAPLPPMPNPQPANAAWKLMPPKPELSISRVKPGIVLSWKMPFDPMYHAEVSTYQIYAYQESSVPSVLTSALWKKVGDVRALPLPMACTLTQFLQGHTYHFAVRPVDVHSRVGSFSDPSSITLT